MIKQKDMKLGQALLWPDVGSGSTWSGPLIVSAIKEGYFKIKKLSDLEESHWLLNNQEARDQLIVLSQEKLSSYINDKTAVLKQKVADARKELKKFKEATATLLEIKKVKK